MQIYHYSPVTGEFLGAGLADESPLEPGVFLLPSFSTEMAPPATGQDQIAVWEDSAWAVQEVEPEPEEPEKTINQIANEKRYAVQAEKCRVRDAGTMVNGVLFDTDLSARIAYMELFTQFAAEPTFTVAWKASNGNWVTMTAALYQQVMAAGKARIQAAFAWQAGKDAEIDAALAAGDKTALEAISTVYEA